MSTKSFVLLMKNALAATCEEQSILAPISTVMLRKLGAYDRLVCSDLARLATISMQDFQTTQYLILIY